MYFQLDFRDKAKTDSRKRNSALKREKKVDGIWIRRSNEAVQLVVVSSVARKEEIREKARASAHPGWDRPTFRRAVPL